MIFPTSGEFVHVTSTSWLLVFGALQKIAWKNKQWINPERSDAYRIMVMGEVKICTEDKSK